MWYYSNIAFALVDVTARNRDQVLFLCCTYFLNIIIYTMILSIFYTTLEILNNWSNNLENALDNYTLILEAEKIDEQLKEMVYEYKIKTYQTEI